MKNYPLLLAIIFSIVYIGITLFLYFGERFETMKFLPITSMAVMIPMVVLTIRLQRDFIYGGQISGRKAAKEGMHFVIYTIIFLLIFQSIFVYCGWGEFIMENLPPKVREQVEKKGANYTILFIDLFFVFFRFIFVGIFTSFISAVFLKTTR